jgi:hypothetical protein
MDYGSKMRHWGNITGNKDIIKKAFPRPWVCEYSSMDTDNRNFIKGFTDHEYSNSDGSKPVPIRFMVEVGKVYKIFSPMPKGGGICKIYRIIKDGKKMEEMVRD